MELGLSLPIAAELCLGQLMAPGLVEAAGSLWFGWKQKRVL